MSSQFDREGVSCPRYGKLCHAQAGETDCTAHTQTSSNAQSRTNESENQTDQVMRQGDMSHRAIIHLAVILYFSQETDHAHAK